MVLCGDYGTGKTSLLVFAAMEASKDQNFKVVFIPATNLPSSSGENVAFILDEAVKIKFEGSNVEVVTMDELRRLHGEGAASRWDDRHHLIREYLKTNTESKKVFIDDKVKCRA